MSKKEPIGFIGQGWIGRNYADNFETRGYKTVRYALEPQFSKNKELIKTCPIVFIAVPTPTTPKGFSSTIVENALALLAKGQIAVIKSTILPGTTARLQKKYPHITVLYCPEFLSEATVKHDVAHPFLNIIGLSEKTPRHTAAAKKVMAILTRANFSNICSSTEAEIIKYTHNSSGYVQIIFFNMMYDLAVSLGCDWSVIEKAIGADPFIPNRYSKPVHKSGRGAGGACFIKDFSALRELFGKALSKDKNTLKVFRALEEKNIDLLTSSGKDIALLRGVYGPRIK